MYKNYKSITMMLALGALSVGAADATPFEMKVDGMNVVQQAGTCTGVVKDANGEAIIGASVVVKGTTNGVITDIDGNFILSNVKSGDLISISYIGFATKEMKWTGQPLNVTLTEDVAILDEVVVTAYGGRMQRSKVTNSISKVDSEVLSSGLHSNPAQALSGAVAGLSVRQTSGDPGATPTIILRGGTSLDGSGSPLVIVDGVQRSMADINPSDIESMEVMKDAGATAIYGARAANGVILITTKRGKEGHTSINVKAKVGVNYYHNNYNFLGARDYLWWQRTAYQRSSNIWTDSKGNSQGIINMSSLSGAQPYGTGNIYFNSDGTPADGNLVTNANWSPMVYTDDLAFLLEQGWQTMTDPVYGDKIIFKEFQMSDVNIVSPAITQDYTLELSGGNEKGTYFSSIGYNDSDGNAVGNWYKRFTFTFNADYKLRSWLTSNSSFNFSHNTWYGMSATVSAEDYFNRVLTVPPTFRGTNPNGEWLIGTRGTRDANQLLIQPYLDKDNNTDKFSISQAFTIHILKGLDLKLTGSWYYEDTKYEDFNRDYLTGPNTWYRTRYSSDQYDRNLNQTYNAVATYNHTFKDKHSLNIMAGTEYYTAENKGFFASGYGAPTDDFQDLALTLQTGRDIDSWHNQNRILSFFGKVDYDFKGKYLVSGVLRQDGYSRLAKDNRWGLFPGISAGWVISKEKFMEKWSNVLTYSKLRASYGANGNLDTNYIGNYTVQGAYGPQTNYNGSTAILLSTLPNPGLRWEKSYTFEVGLDLGFLDNRYTLSMAYYNRRTKDKLAYIPLPSHVGVSQYLSNNGEIQNQGFEFEVHASIINSGDFKWDVNLNGAFNKNKVITLPYNGLTRNRQNAVEVYTGNGTETMWVGGYQEGQSPGDIYAFQAEGIYQSYDEIPGNLIDRSTGNNGSNNKPLYGPDAWAALSDAEKSAGLPIQPGDVKWKDVNGDGVIDDFDKVKVGNTIPKWTGGINTTFTWKGLALNARFDYALGHSVIDYRTPWIMGNMQGTYNTVDLVFDTWSPENPGGQYPMYGYADQLGKRNYARESSMFIYKGNYLAIREISLAYSLPKQWINKLKMTNVQVSVSGQNLGYLTPAKNMATPEYGASSYGSYALPRSVIFGLNVSF